MFYSNTIIMDAQKGRLSIRNRTEEQRRNMHEDGAFAMLVGGIVCGYVALQHQAEIKCIVRE